jgi:nitrogen regulatory protein P-II 1
MKCLNMFIPAGSRQALADLLLSRPEVVSFTFFQVEGHYPEQYRDPDMTVRDRVVGYVPRVRVELLLEDDAVDSVLATIHARDIGCRGQGSYWVTEVMQMGRL